MNIRVLSVYLNDHLAASSAALGLLSRLIARTGEGSEKLELEALHREIAEDRETLREVLRRLEIPEGGLRRVAAKAGGWFARKKFEIAGLEEGGGGRLQALEALFLGVTGKTALWRVLRDEAVTGGRLREMPLKLIHNRSRGHCERVEELRLAEALRMTEKA